MKLQWQAPVKALEMWNPEIKAASTAKNTIDIYDVIGEGLFYEGVTARKISSALDVANGDKVTVNINSAGGDMFEGLAIYNLLKEYEGDVEVKVMGMAASAASIIAMAGDDIKIGESAFFMIHNAWSCMCGNKNDFAKMAQDFSKFDESMAKVYVKKTGQSYDDVVSMMDAETWLGGDEAIEKGFASGYLEGEEIVKEEAEEGTKALRKIDNALAKAGIPRSERRNLLKELTSTPCATDTTPCASDESLKEELKTLLAKLNTQ